MLRRPLAVAAVAADARQSRVCDEGATRVEVPFRVSN